MPGIAGASLPQLDQRSSQELPKAGLWRPMKLPKAGHGLVKAHRPHHSSPHPGRPRRRPILGRLLHHPHHGEPRNHPRRGEPHNHPNHGGPSSSQRPGENPPTLRGAGYPVKMSWWILQRTRFGRGRLLAGSELWTGTACYRHLGAQNGGHTTCRPKSPGTTCEGGREIISTGGSKVVWNGKARRHLVIGQATMGLR